MIVVYLVAGLYVVHQTTLHQRFLAREAIVMKLIHGHLVVYCKYKCLFLISWFLIICKPSAAFLSDCWSYHVGRWIVNEKTWKTIPKLPKSFFLKTELQKLSCRFWNFEVSSVFWKPIVFTCIFVFLCVYAALCVLSQWYPSFSSGYAHC